MSTATAKHVPMTILGFTLLLEVWGTGVHPPIERRAASTPQTVRGSLTRERPVVRGAQAVEGVAQQALHALRSERGGTGGRGRARVGPLGKWCRLGERVVLGGLGLGLGLGLRH